MPAYSQKKNGAAPEGDHATCQICAAACPVSVATGTSLRVAISLAPRLDFTEAVADEYTCSADGVPTDVGVPRAKHTQQVLQRIAAAGF